MSAMSFGTFGSVRVPMPEAREEFFTENPAPLPRAIKPQDVPFVFSWARRRVWRAMAAWAGTFVWGDNGPYWIYWPPSELVHSHIQSVTVTLSVDTVIGYFDNTLWYVTYV